jgi:hypothetical protein
MEAGPQHAAQTVRAGELAALREGDVVEVRAGADIAVYITDIDFVGGKSWE